MSTEYFVDVATALSQLLNAVIGGDPNETVSGRCYRENRDLLAKVIDTIFFFDPFHCQESHIKDRLFARKILGEYKNG